MVSDDNKSYRNIIDDMGVPHQLCNFHLKKNFMNDLLKPMNKIKRKTKSLQEQIENIISKLPFYNSEKNKKKNKKKLKELKTKKRKNEKKLKEYENYKERVLAIFDCEDEKNAKRRFKLLYNNMEHLPPAVMGFIRRLSKNLDRGINHMRYDFLPNTNNQIECYNGAFTRWAEKYL
ncbi:MAG: Pseudogene of transposase [Methanobrevibacter sp. CfCl-M3]